MHIVNDLQSTIIPKLDLATTVSRSNLNDPDLKLYLNEPIYLMKCPYVTNSVDQMTFILFLCSLSDKLFSFYLCRGFTRQVGTTILDCQIIIKDKAPEGTKEKDIFKISFDSRGNEFYIQILGTSKNIKYNYFYFKRNIRQIKMSMYDCSFEYDCTLNTPYQIRFPQELFKKLSNLFNNKSSIQYSNPFTAMLFYRFSPFHKKLFLMLDLNK